MLFFVYCLIDPKPCINNYKCINYTCLDTQKVRKLEAVIKYICFLKIITVNVLLTKKYQKCHTANAT